METQTDQTQAMTRLKELDFEVLEEPLYFKDKDGAMAAAPRKALLRDNGTIISTVSLGYKLILHRESLLPAVDELFKQGWILAKREAGRRSVRVEGNGRRAYVELIHPEVKVDFGIKTNNKPDLLSPRMVLANGYDGLTSLRCEGGAYQWLCTNGLKTPTKAMIDYVKRRHFGFGGAGDPEKMLNLAKRYLGEFENVVQGYRVLAEVVPGVTKVTEAIHEVTVRHEQKVIDRMEHPSGSATGWQAFSAITNWLTFDFNGSEQLLGQKQRKAMNVLLS